jgi:Family of unknown function (DUF6082)
MGTVKSMAPRNGRYLAGGIGLWSGVACGFVVASIPAGVGLAAFLAEHSAYTDWNKLSDVGQTFGAVSSIISGLTLIAVVITARAQSRETNRNLTELEEQRRLLADNRVALMRTAEASHGRLHFEILKMAVDNDDLAAVWPSFEPGTSAVRNRQYLYANAIYQFQYLAMQDGNYTEEQVLSALRYLFTSPLMRGYWHASQFARTSLVRGSNEFRFAAKVDEICREFEAVAAMGCPLSASHDLGDTDSPIIT